MDAIGLEKDFTLETNRKRVKENLLKPSLMIIDYDRDDDHDDYNNQDDHNNDVDFLMMIVNIIMMMIIRIIIMIYKDTFLYQCKI